MSWKDKMKEWGGGDVSFLSEDGECITFVVVGEPYLIAGKYKGQETQRIGCPIWSLEGFSLLIVGKRVARRLSKHEKEFKTRAFDLVRHGVSGDTNSKYELSLCDVKELESELLAAAKTGFNKSDLDDAVTTATDIAGD